jgi:YgiT-type zinc finger domain-containing protein
MSQPRESCRYCSSAVREEAVHAAVWTGTGLVAFEDIPAGVCEKCGEEFFDEATVERIRKILADPEAPAKRTVSVPVFPISDVVPVGDEEHWEQGEETFCCDSCGSATREETVTTSFWGDRGLVALEGIPARVCLACNERYYDEETRQQIAALMHHGFLSPKPKRKITVPVFSLAESCEVSARRQ